MSVLQSIPTLSPADLHRMEDEAGIEFVGGQIVEKPVSIESVEIETRIAAFFSIAAMKLGTAKVFGSGMGYKCDPEDPAKFRKPDVSVMQTERMKGIDPTDGFFHIPADLVVEVISPGDLMYEVSEKIQEYLQHGFPLIWIVIPATRTLEIYRLGGSPTLLNAGDRITCESLFPGFSWQVGEFFGLATVQA